MDRLHTIDSTRINRAIIASKSSSVE
jgi:hypothetical protein